MIGVSVWFIVLCSLLYVIFRVQDTYMEGKADQASARHVEGGDLPGYFNQYRGVLRYAYDYGYFAEARSVKKAEKLEKQIKKNRARYV